EEATELQRERLQAEKQIAMQQILLAAQPAQPAQPVTYQIVPGEPATAAPILQAAPSPAALPKQDNMILILGLAVIGFLLFTKK
ncbi:unnamed protein product, partial [marine sediment metagenome]